MTALIGREREQARLSALLDRTIDGFGSLVMIRGEAGIGKTALARWISAEAADRDCLVLSGRAHPHGRLISYGPLVEALGRVLRQLDDDERTALAARIAGLSVLFPGLIEEPALPPASDDLALTRTLEAIRGTLVHLASDRPVVMTVDDLQWADPATLRAMTHFAAELEVAPILLLVTLRDGADADRPDVRSTVAAFRRLGARDELSPARLDTTEVRLLLAQVEGRPPEPDRVDEIVERTAGTPLFVEAIARAGAARGRPTPAAVTDAIHERLDGLNDAGAAILRALAVATISPAPALVQRVAELDDLDFENGLDALLARRLVTVDRADEPRLDAAHPLIGEVVEQAMSPVERSRLHLAYLDELLDDDPEICAEHVVGAGDRVGPDRAVDVLIAAADRAASRQAYRSVAAHTNRALDLVAGADRPTTELAIRERLFDALFGLGEYEAAEAVAAEALELRPDDPVDRLPALIQVELIAWLRRGGEAELRALRDAVWGVPADDLRRSVILAFERLLTAYARRDRVTESKEIAEELVRRTQGSSEPAARALHLIGRSYLLEFARRYASAARLLDDAASAARIGGVDELLDRVRLVQLDCAMVIGPVEDIERRHARLGSTRASAISWRDHVVHFVLGLAQLDPGWLDEQRAPPGFDRHSLPTWPDPVVTAFRAWVTSDGELAEEAMATIGGDPGRRSLPRVERDRWAAAAAQALIDHDVDAARRTIGIELVEGPRATVELLLAELRGQLALLAGAPDLVEHQAAQLEASDGGTGWASAHAAKLRALLTGSDVDGLIDAADRFEAVGDRHQVARCLTRAAQLDRARSPDDRLAALLVPVTRAGLQALAEEIAEVLGTDERPATNGRVLTKRQLEIAELVAEGLSNAAIADRLFISVRTVTSHLDHIYTRLGIGNRTELAVLLPQLR